MLKRAGVDALTVTEQSWGGYEDERLWELLQAEHRMLITADKGFADAQRIGLTPHHGVVLLRPERESRQAFLRLMEDLLDSENLDDLVGAVTVVSERGIRIRRARK